MMPSRYVMPKPAQIKRQVAQVKHVSAPLKGLSLSSKLVPGDPLTATVLDNWIVEENQITSRPGCSSTTLAELAGHPVDNLVPFYGQPNKLAAAGNFKLVLFDNTVVEDGFTSDDWSWTAFSNLSSQDYTVMVNGHDGVWSWDGGAAVDPGPVTVTSVTNANPAVVTVAPADIGKFVNGQVVLMAGVTGGGMTVANGRHYIGSVGFPANTFVLVGVNTSAGAGPATVGITADPPGSMQKEVVTAPSTDTWVNPDQMNIVLAHMNRLWFADNNNLAVYYLPLQQKGGELKVLPLNALFRRGGSIRAMATWTVEGAVNLNDELVIFSTNGEAVIYTGTDPDSDFELAGIFRFDSPMSKRAVINYGGDLYALISTGVVPFSTLMRAESEQLGVADKNVFSIFSKTAQVRRDAYGWQLMMDPSTGRLIANLPQGGVNRYSQMVRFMPNPIWASWSNLKARCWGWVDNRLYFGSETGQIFEMSPLMLNDDGQPIKVDVQGAWSNYGTPAAKQFKMVLPYLLSDGTPRPFVDIKVDYDMTPPTNQPDVTFGAAGAAWDTAPWDTSSWAQPAINHNNWSGVADIGRVGAPRLTALILDCEFRLNGWDVLFEAGSLLG